METIIDGIFLIIGVFFAVLYGGLAFCSVLGGMADALRKDKRKG